MDEYNIEKRVDAIEEELSRVKRMYEKCFHYQSEDPEIALNQARKSAEAICKQIYVHSGFHKKSKPVEKMMLNDLLQVLTREKVLPRRIAISFGTIQAFGNFGTHDQGSESEKITEDYIKPCLHALSTVVNWYFSEFHGRVPELSSVSIESENVSSAPRIVETRAAKMDGALKKLSIAEMAIGESGWAVPWAIDVDDQGNSWLDGNHTLHNSSGGTVAMLIKRSEEGYVVDTSNCDYKWRASGDSYANDSRYLPIVEISNTRIVETRTAKMDGALKKLSIAEMAIGESGWAVPWAIQVDDQGNSWLNGHHTLHNSSGGTVAMLIKLSEEGYIADISNCDYKWSASGDSYANDSRYLPIVEIFQGNRFIPHRDTNIIKDKKSCLEWLVGPDENTTHYQAGTWVASLGDGWRMPSKHELKDLYKSGIKYASWGPLQNNGVSVWSGEIKLENPSLAYSFYFDDGSELECIRDGGRNRRAFAVRLSQ